MSEDGFYRAFEDRYRGSRALIKERLKVYLPFILPLREIHPEVFALDLGCGRGEWLELLREHSVAARGVDLDESMLSACLEAGLDALAGDAVAYLKSLPDASVSVVSGFHVAEHIPFTSLRLAVDEALRALRPGGLLILETPDPENIVVGTSGFYLDPSHLRPIPAQLLSFVAEYQGFARVRILRLQESSRVAAETDPALLEIFRGASPDYAVVAQKLADPDVMAHLDAAFAARHGLQLAELAERYDGKIDRRLGVLADRISDIENFERSFSDAMASLAASQGRLVEALASAQAKEDGLAALANRLERIEGWLNAQHHDVVAAKVRAEELEGRLLDAEERAAQAEDRAALAEADRTELAERLGVTEAECAEAVRCAREAQIRATEAKARADELERVASDPVGRPHESGAPGGGLCRAGGVSDDAQVWRRKAEAFEIERDALLNSWSWRITAPARWIASPARAGGLRRAANHGVRVGSSALRRPLGVAMQTVLRRPALSYRINQLLLRFPALHRQLLGIAREEGAIPGLPAGSFALTADGEASNLPDHLTPQARRVLVQLRAAINPDAKDDR